MRVLLVEDHDQVRARLWALLRAHPAVTEVVTAATQRTAVRTAREMRPHAVVLGVAPPHDGVVEVVRRIRRSEPTTGVLLLASADEGRDRFAAVMAGAAALVPKTLSVPVLLGELESVGRGEVPLARPEREAILDDRIRHARRLGAYEALPRDARPLLDAVLDGRTDVEIAAELGCTADEVLARVLELYRALRP